MVMVFYLTPIFKSIYSVPLKSWTVHSNITTYEKEESMKPDETEGRQVEIYKVLGLFYFDM